MGVPIIFLIIAPLASIIAMQLTPPFSRIAVILSLIFSICGLALLYRYLLLPLRSFVTAISQPDCAEIPTIPTACDVVRALEDSLMPERPPFAMTLPRRAKHQTSSSRKFRNCAKNALLPCRRSRRLLRRCVMPSQN